MEINGDVTMETTNEQTNKRTRSENRASQQIDQELLTFAISATSEEIGVMAWITAGVLCAFGRFVVVIYDQ